MAFTGRVINQYNVSSRGFLITVDLFDGEPEDGDILDGYLYCKVSSVVAVHRNVNFRTKKEKLSADLMIVGQGRSNITQGDVISGGRG